MLVWYHIAQVEQGLLYIGKRSGVSCLAYYLPRPRVTPDPRAIPLTGLRVVVDDDGLAPDIADVVLVPLALAPELEILGVRPSPLFTRPLETTRVPLEPVISVRFRSSSSAFRVAASLCCWSSLSRLSAACCLRYSSFSMSAAS